MPAPEATARETIDAQLSAAGWHVAAPGSPIGTQLTALCESSGDPKAIVEELNQVLVA